MRGLFPKKKSRLSPQGKAIAAAHALLDTMEGRFGEKAAGRWLREEVGLQWSMLTCLQYLSGKEALGALKALPIDWSERGRTKQHFQAASILAAHAVANVRQDGRMLCASDFAHELKGKTVEQWVTASAIFSEKGAGSSV